MIVTEEGLITDRKPHFSVTLSTTNPTRTDLGANPALRGEEVRDQRVTAYS